MAVRLKDIARDLDVSVVTVSKVLRNQGDISEETRRRVLERARELNYQPNWVARSLVTRKTYIVGLVVPDLIHSFFAEVARGMARGMRGAGYHVLIVNTDEDPAVEVAEIEHLLARQVDGLAVATSQAPGDLSLFRRIEATKTPYVLVDRWIEGVAASFAGISDLEAGRVATQHLLAKGRRRIAHLHGPNNATSAGRRAGYEAALREAGIEPDERLVLPGLNDDGGYAATTRLLAREPRPDAVFGYNDPVASGAIKAVLEAGLRVPEDVAVIGIGNVHYSDQLRVPMSTVDQTAGQIGERAAELLLEQLAAKTPVAPRRIILPAKVVVRESTAGRRNG